MLSNLKYRDLSVVRLSKQPTFGDATTVSPRNDFWETSAGRVTTQIWVVLLIAWTRFPTRHDQSEALPRSPNVGCFLRLVSGEQVNYLRKVRKKKVRNIKIMNSGFQKLPGLGIRQAKISRILESGLHCMWQREEQGTGMLGLPSLHKVCEAIPG